MIESEVANKDIIKRFEVITAAGENILWVGRPAILSFISWRGHALLILIATAQWIFGIFVSRALHHHNIDALIQHLVLSVSGAFLLATVIWLALAARKTEYAITDTSIMLWNGFPRPIMKIIELSKVESATIRKKKIKKLTLSGESVKVVASGDVTAEIVGVRDISRVFMILSQALEKRKSKNDSPVADETPSAGQERTGTAGRLMPLHRELTRHFDTITDTDEKIIWIEKPVFYPFILKDLWGILFALVWGALFVYPLFRLYESGKLVTLGGLLLLAFLLPCWVALAYLVKRIVLYTGTLYAYTDKRLIIKKNAKFSAVQHGAIGVVDVTVTPLEQLFTAGTIHVMSPYYQEDAAGSPHSAGILLNQLFLKADGRSRIREQLLGVRHPYKVFQNIRKLLTDKHDRTG